MCYSVKNIVSVSFLQIDVCFTFDTRREDDLFHEILDCENISRESSLLRFLINKKQLSN